MNLGSSNNISSNNDTLMLQRLILARNATVSRPSTTFPPYLPPFRTSVHSMLGQNSLTGMAAGFAMNGVPGRGFPGNTRPTFNPYLGASTFSTLGTTPSRAIPSNPSVPSSQGLDLLRAVSLSLPNHQVVPSTAITVASDSTASASNKADPEVGECAVPNKSKVGGQERYYVDKVRETDILCGRGGRSNHHSGNKRYRQVVADIKQMYRKTEAKNLKTDLSRAIVDHCCAYGGRFLKKEESSGRFYVLSKQEARKKTSQALRETKALKWTV